MGGTSEYHPIESIDTVLTSRLGSTDASENTGGSAKSPYFKTRPAVRQTMARVTLIT